MRHSVVIKATLGAHLCQLAAISEEKLLCTVIKKATKRIEALTKNIPCGPKTIAISQINRIHSSRHVD